MTGNWLQSMLGAALALVLLGPGTASAGATATADGGHKLTLHSSALAAGKDAPKRFSCQGEGVSPPLSWTGVPKQAKSLALIVDDPDAPSGDWVHWVVYNLPADTAGVGEGVGASGLPQDAANGRNSWGETAYGGLCPPSGRHHYHFKVYALDTTLDAKPYKKQALLEAMHGHVLARGEMVATYRKR